MRRTSRPAGATDRPDLPGWSVLRPVLIYHLITRAAIIIGLLVAAPLKGLTFVQVIMRWDGRWYHDVAVEGYPAQLPIGPAGTVESNTAAFFPLFPLLVRGLMELGVPFWAGCMIINLLASSAAVLIIVLVGAQYLDRHAAQLLGCLWTTFPVSVVLSTTYSEAVFTLCGAASLLFLLRRRWLLAGLLASLAGVARPPGIVFAGAVGLGALVAVIRDREWRSLLGAAVAPLGFAGTLLGIGLATDRLDAWQVTERDGWHTELTLGREWLRWIDFSASTPMGYLHLATGLFVIVLALLTVATVALRPPLPIIGLVLVGAFLAFGFGGVGMNAAPRVMMTFFPVLAPLAVLLVRCPAPVRRIALVCAVAGTAVIGSYVFALAPVPP